MTATVARRLPLLVIFGALFVAGFAGPRVYNALSLATDKGSYKPNAALKPGYQLVFVLVGNSSCPACAADTLPEAVKVLKAKLSDAAERAGMTFIAIGVATDWSIETGQEMLERFGAFDEVSIGGGWTNSVMAHQIISAGIKPGIPIAAVFVRNIAEPPDTVSSQLEITPLRLLAHRRGANPIIAWARSPSDSVLPIPHVDLARVQRPNSAREAPSQ